MKKVFVLSLLLVFFLAGCGAQEEPETEMAQEQPKKAPEAEQYTKPIMQDPIERDKNPTVVMETNQGTMEIELFWKETPKIAENFLRLTLSGYYDSLIFHRVVPGFVVQGGDPTGTGRGGPGYTLPDEPTEKKHDLGTLAMARGMEGNNGSQFYIALSKERTAHLDAQNFSVFGKVVKGMDVVDKIAQVELEGEKPKEPVIMLKVYEKTE
jgi:peptidyl-prolyl cis-trans isomerase B (cyclophilin B)